MLESYQADQLFLLVGGNPLPNAVAGSLLLKPGGHIVLVYSEATAFVQQRLAAWLEKKIHGATLSSLKVNPAEASSIYSKVQGNMKNAAGSVGLNYTGGKKSMAVHAYRALSDAARNPVMSYLDAASLTLRFDPPNPTAPGSARSIYVGTALELTLEDLIDLHGWAYSRGNPPTRPMMPNTAEALQDAHANGKQSTWNSWKETWREVWKSETDRRTQETEWLRNHSVTIPDATRLSAVAAALKEELGGVVDDQGNFEIGEAAEAPGFSSAGDFCRFLDGSWLESAVLSALQEIASCSDLGDIRMGIHLRPSSGKKFEFEFDVVGLRGYQLFAFSCTTIDETEDEGWALLKSKLFELYIRARQFGGDEARMALVCMANNSKGLQRQVRQSIWPDNPKDRRLRVFGKRDMKHLEKKISKWITSQVSRP